MGRLVLKVKEQEFDNFKVLKLFPLSKANQFIAFYDKDDNEIGLLKNFHQLNGDSLELLEFELEKSYFMPEITRIDLIERSESGWRWRVNTNKGPREFRVASRVEDIHKLSNGQIIIKDADGNKFCVPNLKRLEAKSFAMLIKQL
ncbi:DUF1854 domain-containing protein [bacterium]|nr:DUF1854 domain-containing protein [bacterium]